MVRDRTCYRLRARGLQPKVPAVAWGIARASLHIQSVFLCVWTCFPLQCTRQPRRPLKRVARPTSALKALPCLPPSRPVSLASGSPWPASLRSSRPLPPPVPRSTPGGARAPGPSHPSSPPRLCPAPPSFSPLHKPSDFSSLSGALRFVTLLVPHSPHFVEDRLVAGAHRTSRSLEPAGTPTERASPTAFPCTPRALHGA